MARNYDYPHPMQGRLAKQQLASAAFNATRTYEVLGDDDRLPAWVLMKINTAEDRLRAAADYMRYKANPSLDAYNGAPFPATTIGYGATFGYPGVRNTVIDAGPYLCVSHETENKYIQPLRLLAGLVGGPTVMYAASQLPPSMLRTATRWIGVGMSAWSLWVWSKANRAMAESA